MKLGFLASHRGSDVQAVLEACASGRLAAMPRLVISNNADAEVLERTRRYGVATAHLSGATHPDPARLDARARDGEALLRLEDLDRTRVKEVWSDQMLDATRWLGLDLPRRLEKLTSVPVRHVVSQPPRQEVPTGPPPKRPQKMGVLAALGAMLTKR